MRLRVHAKVAAGAKFRRNGIAFTAEPQTVDTAALGWSEDQVKALIGTPILHVEDLDAGDQVVVSGSAPADAKPKGRGAR